MIIENSMIPQVSSVVKVRNEDFGLLLVSKKTPILALNDHLLFTSSHGAIWRIIRRINNVKKPISPTYFDAYIIICTQNLNPL